MSFHIGTDPKKVTAGTANRTAPTFATIIADIKAAHLTAQERRCIAWHALAKETKPMDKRDETLYRKGTADEVDDSAEQGDEVPGA